MGGFGELIKRDVYTWKRYSAIETVTYFWNIYNVNYTKIERELTLNGTNLFGCNINFSGVDTRYYYIDSIEWNPSQSTWTIQTMVYMSPPDYKRYVIDNHGRFYGSYQLFNNVELEELPDGRKYNRIFAFESYTGGYTTDRTGYGFLAYGVQLLDSRETVTVNSHTYYLATAKQYNRNASMGSYIREETSTNQSQYPDNGEQNDLYYIKQSKTDTSYSQGEYIDTVESESPDTYPVNGVLNGYWYVRE